MTNRDIDRRTIDDFGEQWNRYADIDPDYDSSQAMLADTLGPDFDLGQIRDATVAEIGAGAGRVVKMLLDAGAKHVYALEPSVATIPLARNIASRADRVTILACRGDELPPDPKLDIVISLGVIHHILDPKPVLAAAHAALKPGGKIAIWVYGREGNGIYLFFVEPLRRLTSHLPARALGALAHAAVWLLYPYLVACRVAPGLPLGRYMKNVYGRCSHAVRIVVVYDQLNPAYARYYAREEAKSLLDDAGFVDVETHHHHGYSWTVTGRRRP